jgi:hypothetical protein
LSGWGKVGQDLLQAVSTGAAALLAVVAVGSLGDAPRLPTKVHEAERIFTQSTVFEELDDAVEATLLIQKGNSFSGLVGDLDFFKQFLCFHRPSLDIWLFGVWGGELEKVLDF